LSGWHKLTLDEVAEIRRLAAAGGGSRRLASRSLRLLGCSTSRLQPSARSCRGAAGASSTRLLSRANEPLSTPNKTA